MITLHRGNFGRVVKKGKVRFTGYAVDCGLSLYDPPSEVTFPLSVGGEIFTLDRVERHGSEVTSVFYTSENYPSMTVEIIND